MIQDRDISPSADTMHAGTVTESFFKSSHDTVSEIQSSVGKPDREIRSFFTSHALKPGSQIEPDPAARFQPDWIFGLLIFCFLLQAWVQFLYRKRFRQLLLAPFSKRFLNQLSREGNLFNERLALALGMVYIICMSLLVFEINSLMLGGQVPPMLNPFTFFLLIMVAIIAFWMLKISGILFAGMVFRTDATTNMYLLNVLVANITTGLILLPVLVMVIYLKSVLFLYVSLSILALSLLFLFFRGFFIGLSLTKFSYVFLFVYLCTLEILPLIIMTKFSLMFYNSMLSVN
jgi:hypothetical protein